MPGSRRIGGADVPCHDPKPHRKVTAVAGRGRAVLAVTAVCRPQDLPCKGSRSRRSSLLARPSQHRQTNPPGSQMARTASVIGTPRLELRARPAAVTFPAARGLAVNRHDVRLGLAQPIDPGGESHREPTPVQRVHRMVQRVMREHAVFEWRYPAQEPQLFQTPGQGLNKKPPPRNGSRTGPTP